VDVQAEPGEARQEPGLGEGGGDAGPIHDRLGLLPADVLEEDGRPLGVRAPRPADEALEREELGVRRPDLEDWLEEDCQPARLEDGVE
jgi:hypothetical protein